MSDEKQGVTDSESPDEKASESHSELGKASSKSGERTVEQVQAENKRKAEEIAELKEQLKEIRETQEERLEELQSKSRLSAADKQEMETLEDQIASIKADARSKPWLKINEDISVKSANREVKALDMQYTEDYVAEIAEAEKIPYEKFEREIVKFMQRVDPGAEMTTLRRAKKAYKLYKEEMSYATKMAELKEKEKQFAEQGGARPSKPQSKSELLESAKSPKGMEELLKAIHSGQAEATSR